MLSDKNREQLEKLEDVVSVLRKAADAVDEFYQLELDYGRDGKPGEYLPLDDARFKAVCNLPVMLAEAGASLARVMTGLADAKQARKTRLDAVKARAKARSAVPTWAEQANGAPMPGGHGSLDATRHGE